MAQIVQKPVVDDEWVVEPIEDDEWVVEAVSGPDPNDAIRQQQAAKYPTSKEQGGMPGQAVQNRPNYVSEFLPTWSAVPPVVGGVVGTALGGPVGGALGATAVELVSQLGEYATGSERVPQTAGESLTRGAMTAAGASIPIAAKYHAQHLPPIMPAIRQQASQLTQKLPYADAVFRNSESLATRGLKPGDVDFQKHLPAALNEIKGAERLIGPITTAGKALQATEVATRENNRLFKMIVLPQRTVRVPGSGAALRQSQIDAIPDDIRLSKPQEYERIVKSIIDDSPADDMTLGQLDDIRVSANKLLDPKYGKVSSKQLAVDEQLATALAKARGDTSRLLMYEGMDRYGLGGGESAREIGRRMGAVMQFRDALEQRFNTIVSQRAPSFEKALDTVKRTGQRINIFGQKPAAPPIEDDLLTAIRRWGGRSEPLRISLEPRVTGITGVQQELMPRGGGPLFQQPQGYSQEELENVYRMLYPPETRPIRAGRLLGAGHPLPPPTEPPSGGYRMTVETGPPLNRGYGDVLGVQPKTRTDDLLARVKKAKGR